MAADLLHLQLNDADNFGVVDNVARLVTTMIQAMMVFCKRQSILNLAGGGGVTDDDNSVTKRYLKNRIFNS
jgi:hypothetical protein